MTVNKGVVADASAMIALLREEPGAAVVERYFGHLTLLSLNAAETVFRMMRYIPAETLEPMVSDFAEIVPMGAEIAFFAARFKEKTREFGLSYGDCACLALAHTRNIPVLTADKIWKKLDIGVEVRLIR